MLYSLQQAETDWPCLLFDYHFPYHATIEMIPTYQFICTGILWFHGNGFLFQAGLQRQFRVFPL